MISRCPSCAAEVSEEAAQCPSCYWDFAAFKRIPPAGAPATPPPAEAPPPKVEEKTDLSGTGSARAGLQMYSFAETEELTKTAPSSFSPKNKKEPAIQPPPPETVVPEEKPRPAEPIAPIEKVQPLPPPPPPPAEPRAPEFGEGLKVEPPFSVPALPPSRQKGSGFSVGSIPSLAPMDRQPEHVKPETVSELPKAAGGVPPAKEPAPPPPLAASEPPAPANTPESLGDPDKRPVDIPRTYMIKKAVPPKAQPSAPASKAATDAAARFKKKEEAARTSSRLKAEPEGDGLPIRWLAGGLAVVTLGGGLAIYIATKPDSTSTRKTGGEAIFKKTEDPAPLPTLEKKPEPVPTPAPTAPVPPPQTPVTKAPPPPEPAKPQQAAPPPAPVVQPPPAPAPVEPKKKAGPSWVFEGRIYGLMDLEAVYHASVIVKDEAGNEVGRTISADEGRYSVSVPAPASGACQVSVEQPDYLALYVDETSPPFKSINREERAALKAVLSKATKGHQPWIGKTSKSTKRDIIMIPRLSSE